MASILLAPVIAAAKPFWSAVISLGAGFIDQQLFSSSVKMEGARLSDLSVQSSAYGVPIDKIIGTRRVTGNIIWGTNFIEHKQTETHGGKGGKTKSTTYWYTVSCAIGICSGPITGINRVWADGKEVTHMFTPPEASSHPLLEAFKKILKSKFKVEVNNSSIAYSLYAGTDWQEPDSFIQGIEKKIQVPAYRDLAYLVLKDMDLTPFGNRIPNFTFEVIGHEYSVASSVRLISRDTCLVDDGDKDMTVNGMYGITAPGMVVSSSKSHRENIEQLMMFANFGASEIDGKVIFRLKTDYPVYEVNSSEWGAREGSVGEDNNYSIVRKHDLELPRSCTIAYISIDKDYQQGTQTAIRPNCNSQNTISLTLDLALTDAQAKALAEQKLYELWVRRTTFTGNLGPRWSFLAPGYILDTVISSRARKIQLIRVSVGANGIVKVEGSDIGGNTYTIASRNTDNEINQSPSVDPSAVQFEILDMSRPVVDATSDSVVYFAATGSPYIGVAVYETRDSGASWTLKNSAVSRAVMGKVTTLLGSGTTEVWDHANVITVQVVAGTLESRPEIDVLNGYNAAMVGNEVIQFKSAVLVAVNTYVLSGLLRGRLGTEDQIYTHEVNERFVLLDSVAIGVMSAPMAEWYADKRYKIAPLTKDIHDSLAIDVTFRNTARIFQPWSVCHVKGSRNAAGDLTVTWIRRDRANTVWLDRVDMPLSELSELYEVDIIDEGDIVLRTFQVSSPTVTYTAAQQIADFTAVQSAVKLRLYQISSIRGRGIEKEVLL